MNIKLIEWVLRISVAGEFIGHGVFAIQGKKDWIGWFSKFGVYDAGLATKLLLIIGIIDIAVAICILLKLNFKLNRWVLIWAVAWGFWTALLRPIIGMPIWDFVERWANWGAPLALYLLLKNQSRR